ncbi:hypothetical protein LB506_002268 [Fusarium annulatum]|nr:hypothetical protein LB506_002268 [Fusarium annulatum]
MRHHFAFWLTAAAVYLAPIALGQQLGFRYPYETMTLSDSCLRILNTNVTECSPLFPSTKELNRMQHGCRCCGIPLQGQNSPTNMQSRFTAPFIQSILLPR